MMVRLLYILGLCALSTACAIVARGVDEWRHRDPESDRLQVYPGVVDVFKRRQETQGAGDGGQSSSLLLVQAEAFAAYLNPPVMVVEQGASAPVLELGTRVDASPPVRPKEVSVDFRVVAVSCYPDRPERSMALIAASSDSESEAKWVKEGAGIWHFVVHEIKRGAVVLRNGEQQCELAVERSHVRRALVRGVLAGTRQVSAAMPDGNGTEDSKW